MKNAARRLGLAVAVLGLLVGITGQAKAGQVLFIDDDRGLNGQSTWLSTLVSLGRSVDYEAISDFGNPVSNLANYQVVIWSNGDQAYTNLTAQNVATLATYLNNGGSLLYAGGHNVYDETQAGPFISTYLGLNNFVSNMPSMFDGSNSGTATGTGDPITGTSTYSFHSWAGGYYGGTMMSGFGVGAPTATGLLTVGPQFSNTTPGSYLAAINETATYKTATWGFDLNQLDPQYRAQLLGDTLDRLAPVPEPSSIALVCTALPMGLGLAWKRRRKAVSEANV